MFPQSGFNSVELLPVYFSSHTNTHSQSDTCKCQFVVMGISIVILHIILKMYDITIELVDNSSWTDAQLITV